jgi:hypothetical protein
MHQNRGNRVQKTQQPRFSSTPIRRTPSSPSRASLRQSSVLNYARIERIENPFMNPPYAAAAPRTPSALRHVEITTSDEDIQMGDGGEARDEDREPESPFAGQRRPEYAIPTTVTLHRAQEQGIQVREPI